MRRRPLWLVLLPAAILTAPLIGLMYLAAQLAGLPFLPFDLFDWITRILPGDVVTFGIDTMIDTMLFLGVSVADTAKTAEQVIAVLQFWVGGAVIGAAVIYVLSRRPQWPAVGGGARLGVVVALPLIAIHLAIRASDANPVWAVIWLLLLFGVWGAALGWVAARLFAPTLAQPAAPEAAIPEPDSGPEPAGVPSVPRLNRRQFLVRLAAGAATITVLSGGVGAALATAERRRRAEAAVVAETLINERMLPNADAAVMPAPGTRPEYTPVEDHYKVFLRAQPTVIEEAEWVLPIEGMVDNPLQLTLEELRNDYEAREQYVTLSCISGRIGTTLISTTKWTGVSVQDVLRDAGVQAGAAYLFITSGDGFHETVSLDMINQDERIMFCYAWDDRPLPTDHGFPLRIWIPDRYGMKQPKWITHIEVTDTYTEGYWVERNWDEVAQVKVTSVIDTVALDAVYEENGRQLVPVGGIAFAGDREISKVEVRVNGGAWQEALLRNPLSDTTWVIWRYDWPFEPGHHTFEVRCVDGGGVAQIEESRPNRPSGATGIHSYDVNA